MIATERIDTAFEVSRRAFLTTTAGALAGMAAFGFVDAAAAGTRHPKRGGTLNYGAATDTSGLDAHHHNQLHISHPTSVMYTGLTDIDYQGNIVPSLAESWEPSKDLTAWVFRLRKGVLFHNGREVDAEAVKLNLERIKNPAIGGGWERGAIANVDSVEVFDKYTVRIKAVSIQGQTFRYDPDDFFGRDLHSKSEYSRVLSGWENARYDQLVEEARRTQEPARRKALYTEAWNIANAELPFFYLHEFTQTSAADKTLRGYRPGSEGALAYHSGGLRAAYIEA